MYNQVLIELLGDYKFFMKDDELGLQLRMKAISVIFWQTGLTDICRGRTLTRI